MGFSIKELTYNHKPILYLTKQELAGPWVSFNILEDNIGALPIILKNIEPTPIYKLINSRKGKSIDRITLDFDINAYLNQNINQILLQPIKLKKNESEYIRLYIDIFSEPHLPYINTYFTFKNISSYNLIDFNIYFIFDFDINGLEGYDNDLSGYDKKKDIIYQYDKTNIHAGFSPISKSTYYETCLTNDFHIDSTKKKLSNTLYNHPGEILSALQIEFKTLKPFQTFQTALTISGGYNREELIENISNGKIKAIKYLKQVNRNIKSRQRNKQEEAFQKLNLQRVKDCSS